MQLCVGMILYQYMYDILFAYGMCFHQVCELSMRHADICIRVCVCVCVSMYLYWDYKITSVLFA